MKNTLLLLFSLLITISLSAQNLLIWVGEGAADSACTYVRDKGFAERNLPSEDKRRRWKYPNENDRSGIVMPYILEIKNEVATLIYINFLFFLQKT